MTLKKLCSCFCLIMLASCQSSPKINVNLLEQPNLRMVKKDSAATFHKSMVSNARRTAQVSHATRTYKNQIEIDRKYQSRIKAWIEYLLTKGRDRFIRQIEQGLKYRKLVETIFERYDLPKELFFLGLIESGYNLKAYSRSKAVGPWQFMKGTAKVYDLRIDRSIDERRHIIKSTEAAAMYLKDLHNIFASWPLALMGYNAGEYKILRAIKKANTRSFVQLIKKRAIPRETQDYIPKFLAAKHIVENAKEYDLDLDEIAPVDLELYDEYLLERPANVYSFCNFVGVNFETFKQFNTDIRRHYVWASKGSPVTLYFPREEMNKVLVRHEDYFKKQQALYVRTSKGKNLNIVEQYKVRRGDSLYKISLQFGISVQALLVANPGTNRRNLRHGSIINIPANSAGGSSSIAGKYLVQKGDTLSTIAEKVKVPLRQLMSMNNLRKRSILRIGQVLKTSRKRKRFYVVRRGDSLKKISDRFSIPVRLLRKYNSLTSNTIYPNQKLRVSL